MLSCVIHFTVLKNTPSVYYSFLGFEQGYYVLYYTVPIITFNNSFVPRTKPKIRKMKIATNFVLNLRLRLTKKKKTQTHTHTCSHTTVQVYQLTVTHMSDFHGSPHMTRLTDFHITHPLLHCDKLYT